MKKEELRKLLRTVVNKLMKERRELKMFKKNKLIARMMTMIKMGNRRVELKGYDDDFITIIFTVFQ